MMLWVLINSVLKEKPLFDLGFIISLFLCLSGLNKYRYKRLYLCLVP